MTITTHLTVYRRLGALLFERAIQATGLAPGAIGARLREELARPTLTAPTLRAWRRGQKAVPMAAFLAVCRIADLNPAEFISSFTVGEDGQRDEELERLLQELLRGQAVAATEGRR